MADAPFPIPNLEGELVLNAQGSWVHNGTLFTNKNLADLFYRSVTWDEKEKSYILKIAHFRARFRCEDTPYFIENFNDLTTPWRVTLCGGMQEDLNPSGFSIGKENQIYLKLSSGHLARLTRPAHQTLLAHAIDEESIDICGTNVKIDKAKIAK